MYIIKKIYRLYFINIYSLISLEKINLNNNKEFHNYYFLDENKLNTINETYINKYFLRKILYEFLPITLLSLVYLNNISILVLSIFQLILTRNFLNLITSTIFFLYFNLQKEDTNILYIYSIYLIILFLIELILIYEYIPISTKFLSFIGIIFSFIILYKLYADFFKIQNFIIFTSFLITSTGIIPYNIQNTLDKIKTNRKIKNNIYNSYYFM